jgi:hypothetical protein
LCSCWRLRASAASAPAAAGSSCCCGCSTITVAARRAATAAAAVAVAVAQPSTAQRCVTRGHARVRHDGLAYLQVTRAGAAPPRLLRPQLPLAPLGRVSLVGRGGVHKLTAEAPPPATSACDCGQAHHRG